MGICHSHAASDACAVVVFFLLLCHFIHSAMSQRSAVFSTLQLAEDYLISGVSSVHFATGQKIVEILHCKKKQDEELNVIIFSALRLIFMFTFCFCFLYEQFSVIASLCHPFTFPLPTPTCSLLSLFQVGLLLPVHIVAQPVFIPHWSIMHPSCHVLFSSVYPLYCSWGVFVTLLTHQPFDFFCN